MYECRVKYTLYIILCVYWKHSSFFMLRHIKSHLLWLAFDYIQITNIWLWGGSNHLTNLKNFSFSFFFQFAIILFQLNNRFKWLGTNWMNKIYKKRSADTLKMLYFPLIFRFFEASQVVYSGNGIRIYFFIFDFISDEEK